MDISRRSFISSAAITGASLAMARSAFSQTTPNSKLNIAAIGVGGMGQNNLRNVSHENIVAICDVDHKYAGRVMQKYPDAKTYIDYREMLEKHPEIDAVVIATPDHTHAVITMAAMRAGKHVFCQKPLTHDVYEARMIAEAAKETGVITQMGIQGHSKDGGRQIREWIAAGVIGEVTEVDAWCSLSYYPWGHASWSSPLGERPTETPEIPEGVDWDLWLGPAPERPYHKCYHPRSWRSWWDFGCGMMGDRGAHTMDPIVWALDLGQPTAIQASSTGLNDETHPLASIVQYEFPARGEMPPVKLTWYDGLEPPRPDGVSHEEKLGHPEGGATFKGSEGMITCGVYGEDPRLLPESRMKDFEPPAPTIERVTGTHEQDWLDAIHSGGTAGADFAYSGPLTEIALLGNIAKRVNNRIEWDAEKMEVTNIPEANEYVRQKYRDGWTL